MGFPQSPISRPNTHFNLDLRLNGNPTPLGVIACVAGAAKNNHTTAAPFNDAGAGVGLAGRVLLITSLDASGNVLVGSTNAATVNNTPGDAAMGITLSQSERVIITMPETDCWLAFIGAGTSRLQVWELT